MGKFFDLVEELPILFKRLIDSRSYNFETLTEGRIKEIIGGSNRVPGVYLMYDNDAPMYIGRSKTLAQRVGTDERSLGENQATVSKKIRAERNNINDLKEARKYMYSNYTVKFLIIDDEVLRALFQIYVATELQTPFNNFMET